MNHHKELKEISYTYTNDIPKQNKIIACLKHVPKVTNYMSRPTLSTLTPKFIIPRRKCIIKKDYFKK
jgi:hypothetical protein